MSLCLLALAPVILVSTMSSPTSQSGDKDYASVEQGQQWLNSHRQDRLILVTEPRERPIKKQASLPLAWLQRSPEQLNQFKGHAQPGEFYVFQIGVINNGPEPVSIHSVQFSGFAPGTQTVCLNEAVNPRASKEIVVAPGRIQPVWIGVEAEKEGTGSGTVTMSVALGESGDFQTTRTPVQIQIDGPKLPNHGVDEGWRLARLKWLLPSGIGAASEPTKRFHPVTRNGNEIHLTSTTLTVGGNGLPAQIRANGPLHQELLKSPAEFKVITDHGVVVWSGSHPVFETQRNDRVSWRSEQTSADASLAVRGTAEFDGFVRYQVQLEAKRALKLDDIRLEVPYHQDSAKYQLGLGYHGGFTPKQTDWKWNSAYQQDCVWLGDVPVGAQWRFKGSNYQRPLVNIYYGFRPLNLPESWWNDGKGGIQVSSPNPSTCLLNAHSGPRTMDAGDKLEFNFDLQITPSRPIDTELQWATRFYHPNELSEAAKIDEAVDTAKQNGANVINVHHRKPVNPFINYPFNDFSVPDLKKFVRSAHDHDIRVKLYYTTRELTWQLPEIWALKSFGDSIIEPGPGANSRTVINPNGAHPSLTEALENNFIPAWVAQLDGKYAGKLDLAVITRPDSAWTNYYLNGLDWLVKNVQIDGTYIDDTALDRSSLQRARRILEAGRPAPLIDLHSWNHEDPLAARGSSTSIYLELFPYVDRIWLGEGFDYQNATPDYWLVAMSGIPYGVMSEMLQGGGNVWRGMLFGETARFGWSGDPRSMWKYWDQFGMAGTRLIGWWDKSCPVQTDSKDVLATVYVKKGKALVAIANWTNVAKQVKLKVDWKALGINPTSARLTASSIEGFQEKAEWTAKDIIEVPAAKGWLIEIK